MAGRWILPVVCALAGCDTVFGFDRVYDCPIDDDDCDKLRDRVDPCPADPGDDADVDGDGVGDACDPELEAAVDSMVEFEGFATADARWMEREPAMWQVVDSALVLDAGSVERTTPMNSQPTVEAVVDPRFAGEGATVGVLVASKSSTGIPLECFVEHHADGDDLVMVVGDRASPIYQARARQLPAGAAGDSLRIYGGQLSNFVVRCRARYGNNDGLYVDWVFWNSRVDFDTIGFHVDQASADYRALAIYTTAL